MDELDSDASSILAEEVENDEYRRGEEWRPITQVLQMVQPIDTRWNSTLFIIQRWDLFCFRFRVHFFLVCIELRNWNAMSSCTRALRLREPIDA